MALSLARAFHHVKSSKKTEDRASGTYLTLELSEAGERANAIALQKLDKVWVQYLGRGISPSK